MTPRPRAAATAWILGAAVYLTAEALAAAAYRPSYSYASDYISDLGVPGQPLAAPMNVAFAVQGGLFLLGAVLAAGLRRPLLLAFAAANAVGNVLVATVHAGDGALHLVGAALAIVGGNAAAVAGASLHRGVRYRRISRLLGGAGLVSLTVLVAQAWAGVEVLPAPVWERASVYPILAWQVCAAFTMSLPARRQHA
ncbi:DUF998 domain-containing protein [Mycolicibacterium litorale]|uniref:DUF998 domain-containing protein n=1 Tax=Mycolicibacterium litorale TaxID=758802 RepID=A0AAD1IP63_9MYCO|nr:DUF998 domain-containing protein [Mycolicibacterium litorale]MCV7414569.1 DUF998 domain-containing protein [Mycolicibacterium litorale]TDY03430.1 putative membrane protein [Mycolicibacterium litorale]BBY15228.1 hypothetical protein MLIT_08200 [Mycolicibacterium litorale]